MTPWTSSGPGFGARRRASGGPDSQLGFTLIELMVGLIVLAILIAFAVPSYQSLIAEQRVRATVSDLHSALALARSEAIKLNRQITLVPADEGWSSGWRIASPVTGQPALLEHVQAAGVQVDGPAAGVEFRASGRVVSAVTFEVSSMAGETQKTSCLELGLDGRASSSKGECTDG